ncbi:MAG: organic solvent tolerance protein OstA [Moorea sp. SIO4G2]|uniref:Organic solvent tolerance protein OstA n=2 Tax=Moorena TaxID=1155738 RepID=A0A1D8TZ20_9CYAN|nr:MULTISPECIES: LptA/OstA family protein [Moorena]NEO63658.1 organic solvent tolerance protein OstA [Moorena sp. SIO4G2]NEO92248.1 organic solvent tolerance protein OstA [Moorena sp. SIO3G5]AOX02824.1 organic solvent tolerance protein OstA [Moorena producens PAL-8-15-08-1]NEO19920.1 organic solvent tolerance protein OstA [Moorena sp. SIO4A5]NEO79861.1 organic solvent tolerance protein OstA [Moorena sp. SIO4G3]
MKSDLKYTNRLRHNLGLRLFLPVTLVGAIALPTFLNIPQAQAQNKPSAADGSALTVRSDVQEANSKTGVVTARGNVQINYPARQIQATAAQAQYFSRERRLVLNGNVFVLQEGNSIQGETITYLIDEGRFVALPQQNQQVESIYIVTDSDSTTSPAPGLP